MKKSTLTRRAFLAATTTTAAGLAFPARPNDAKVVPRKISPNEKLNIAAIGCGGKGREDIMSCRKENVVALCDVDKKRGGEVFAFYDKAKQFTDYREMLDKMGKKIDAVTVSIPDHSHAPAAYRAMKMGKHVYVQKPMTHTTAEARLLMRTAKEMGVASQMGNQGHSGKGARELCEMVWDGAIGPIHEAHSWTNRPSSWKQGIEHPLPEEPVPGNLDWNMWLGSAPERPYNSGYCPGKWRGWLDFGCGALGDMACHIMDPVFWSLKLGEAKSFTVEPVELVKANNQTYPTAAVLKFQFPARGDMPAVDVYWHDGGKKPQRPADVPVDEELGDDSNGSLFIGKDGYLTAGEYGGRARLLPGNRMDDYSKPEPTIPRVRAQNHYRNWIDACKGGEPACSNFDYAAPFTEVVLAGTIATRVGRRIEYSLENGTIANDREAQALTTKVYRPGFELPI